MAVNHVPVIVFSILIILLIGFGLYCYFALHNGYPPFQFYVVDPDNLPEGAVQPNGNRAFNPFNQQVYVDGVQDDDAKYSADELEVIRNMAASIQQTVCNWYCATGKNTFPLPGGQSLIGPKCDCNLIT